MRPGGVHSGQSGNTRTNAKFLSAEFAASHSILGGLQRFIRDYAHARRSWNDTQRESLRKGAEPSAVHNVLHPGQSRHSAKLRILRKHTQDENSLRCLEVADAVRQLRHDRIRDSLDQGSELTYSAGHWSGGQRLEDPRNTFQK